jgi:dUTP pyrophosphatase
VTEIPAIDLDHDRPLPPSEPPGVIEVPLTRVVDDGSPAPETPEAVEVPRRMRPGDAAADLPAGASVEIPAGERCLVPTGFAVAVPVGACGLVLPRSGLALRQGVTLLNSPGLIDSGYRGELKVLLYNTSRETVTIARGQRIAQFLVLRVDQLDFVEVAALPPGPDDRGAQGFGSSG